MKNFKLLSTIAFSAIFFTGCETATVGASDGPDLSNCRDAAGVNTTALYTCDEVAASPNLGIPEDFYEACVDGLDNDLDGVIDALDPHCAGPLGLNVEPTPTPNPTPSVSGYPFGLIPATASVDMSNALYNTWITDYWEDDPSGTMGRIKWDTRTLSVSEGTAYGMLITLFAGDQARFDKLMNYGAKFTSVYGFMNWRTEGFTKVSTLPGSAGGASDADLDAATSLILAYKKWGDERYLAAARVIITAVKAGYFGYYFDDPAQLCMSESFCQLYNPSYFSPVAFRLFKQYDVPENAEFWERAIHVNYDVVIASQAHGFSLYPNWTDEYGAPNNSINPGVSKDYNKWALESVRVPWRLAWDYAWYGEPKAKSSLDNFTAGLWATHNGDINETGQKYKLTNAGPVSSEPSPAFAGAICIAGQVDDTKQAFVDDCYPKFSGMTNKSDEYFHTILHVMFTQFMTGQYVKPEGV